MLQECEQLECRVVKEEEVLNLHSPAHFSLLQTTSSITNEEKLEDLSSRFDSVYFHPVSVFLNLLYTIRDIFTVSIVCLFVHYYRCVYFVCQGTCETALLAAGGTLDLVDAVASGRLQNGFAIVR